jgi:hypothetical protein
LGVAACAELIARLEIPATDVASKSAMDVGCIICL